MTQVITKEKFMFQALSPLVAERNVHILLSAAADGRIAVYVEPVLKDKESGAFASPFRCEALPTELDQQFSAVLSNWIASFIGLFMIFTLFFVMLLFSGRGNGAFLAFIFAGSLMELVVLGFTTTVVPSMQRCCFLSYTMIEIPVLYYLRMIFRVLRIRERSGRLKEAHKTKKST